MRNLFIRKLTKRFFIVTNFIVAILFLFGCYGYLFNPKYFWFISLLTLSVFYFLLLLIAFIFFWLFIKPVRTLISVIALMLAFKPISNIIAFNLSNSFTKEKLNHTLRIMTWNVAQFNVMENKNHPEIKNKMLNTINSLPMV